MTGCQKSKDAEIQEPNAVYHCENNIKLRIGQSKTMPGVKRMVQRYEYQDMSESK